MSLNFLTQLLGGTKRYGDEFGEDAITKIYTQEQISWGQES